MNSITDNECKTVDFPIGDKLCFAFGKDGPPAGAPPSVGGGSAVAAPPPTPSGGASQPSTPGSNSGGTSCKSDNGLSGTCIPTQACAGDGGSSEPGHCPGSHDIQVCCS